MKAIEEALVAVTKFNAHNRQHPDAELRIQVRIEDGKALFYVDVVEGRASDFRSEDGKTSIAEAMEAALARSVVDHMENVARYEQWGRESRDHLPERRAVLELFVAMTSTGGAAR